MDTEANRNPGSPSSQRPGKALACLGALLAGLWLALSLVLLSVDIASAEPDAGFNLRQSTQTVTETTTLTSTATMTPSITPTLTTTLTAGGQTPSPSPTATQTVSVGGTSSPTPTSTATFPIAQTPTSTVTSVFTESLAPMQVVTVTTTLIPLPKFTLIYPQGIPTVNLYAAERQPGQPALTKGGPPPLLTKLARLWPLAVLLMLLIAIWAVLGIWFVIAQRHLD